MPSPRRNAGVERGATKTPADALPPRARLHLVTSASPALDDADVRWSRVRAARARIDSGYYDRGEVRERLVEAILDELSDG